MSEKMGMVRDLPGRGTRAKRRPNRLIAKGANWSTTPTGGRRILTAQRSKLEVIAQALLEFETLDGVQIREVIGRITMPNVVVDARLSIYLARYHSNGGSSWRGRSADAAFLRLP